MLAKHLTVENYESVLLKASDKSRREIEVLVADLAPRPDVPSTVRKLPRPTATAVPMAGHGPGPAGAGPAMTSGPSAAASPIAPSPPALPASPRPIVQASAPERYRVQFTIGQETHEKLRRLQALLRREIPNGDPGVLFDRALTVLLAKVEKTKLGAADQPRPDRPIRPGRSAGINRQSAAKEEVVH